MDLLLSSILNNNNNNNNNNISSISRNIPLHCQLCIKILKLVKPLLNHYLLPLAIKLGLLSRSGKYDFHIRLKFWGSLTSPKIFRLVTHSLNSPPEDFFPGFSRPEKILEISLIWTRKPLARGHRSWHLAIQSNGPKYLKECVCVTDCNGGCWKSERSENRTGNLLTRSQNCWPLQ